MADPLTIFGSAASVLSTIDILAKASKAILELRNQWKDADMTLLNLTSQLNALRAALTKIKKWMESSVDESHHQLIIDLEASLQCCQLLAMRIDAEIGELPKLDDGTLRADSKAKLIFKSSGIADLQSMMDRQTSALTLLLTACNSNTLVEQQKLLETPKTRKTIETAHKDSASLIVHRDAASLRTQQTDNLSKLSMTFGFDGDLFGSKVYQSVIRDPVKLAFRSRHWRGGSRGSKESQGSAISEETTVQFRPEMMQTRRVKTILVLGANDTSKSTLLRHLNHISEPDSEGYKLQHSKNIDECREAVYQNLRNCFEIFVEILRKQSFEMEDEMEDREMVTQAMTLLDQSPTPIEEIHINWIICIIMNLVDLPYTRRAILVGSDYDLPDNTEYFFTNIQRISEPGYVPTNLDMCHIQNMTTGIEQHRMEINGQTCLLYDVGGSRSERKKWKKLMYDVDLIVFTVSMSDYDGGTRYDESKMSESALLFQSLATSDRLSSVSFILLFTKMDLFAAKIASGIRPLSKYNKDYSGPPTSIAVARDFLTKTITDMYQTGGKLYVQYLDATNRRDIEEFRGALAIILAGKSWRTGEREIVSGKGRWMSQFKNEEPHEEAEARSSSQP